MLRPVDAVEAADECQISRQSAGISMHHNFWSPSPDLGTAGQRTCTPSRTTLWSLKDVLSGELTGQDEG